MEEMKNAYSMWIGNPEGKRQFGRSRSRWEDNIRLDLREIVWEVMDWIYLAEDRG
jgi:hypothetical protein